MSIRRIVPNINSANPSASKPFYEKVLGLDPAMDMGWIITFASPSNPTAQVISVSRWPTWTLVTQPLNCRGIRSYIP